MFEKLFKNPAVLALYKNAPHAKERVLYLAHCAQQGYTHQSLRLIARELLPIAHRLKVYPERGVTSDEIEEAAERWARQQHRRGRTRNPHWPRTRFRQVASQWLRFLGWFHEEAPKPAPFEGLIEDYAGWMERERGFSPKTIVMRCRNIRYFFRWCAAKKRPISVIKIEDIDTFLTTRGGKEWSRVSVANSASALRAFFRFARMRGWCNPSIAEAIQGPRLFAQENLPSGPAWEDVRRLIASLDTDRPSDIRNRPIVMLFAIYALRSSEVSKLQLEDIDWKNDRVSVPRPKQRRCQPYPLIPTVGDAIIRYLQQVRPRSSLREVFLTLNPPFRPISIEGLSSVVRNRMADIGLYPPRRGAHALRHACAARLVAEGFSLKEIGDHLGHRSSSATRIYAKVDLSGLRAVAAFDLGGVI